MEISETELILMKEGLGIVTDKRRRGWHFLHNLVETARNKILVGFSYHIIDNRNIYQHNVITLSVLLDDNIYSL